MSKIPLIDRFMLRGKALHAWRVGVFAFLLAMIHSEHAWYVAQRRGAAKQPVKAEQIRAFYPAASRLGDWDLAHGGQNVFDAEGKTLGYVVQTSPEADRSMDFPVRPIR